MYVKTGQVQGKDNNGTGVYIDYASVRQNGNLRRVWEMNDFPVAREGMLSARILFEYDCTEEKLRVLTASGYSGRMGMGEMMEVEPSPSWDHIAPGTVGSEKLSVVCSERFKDARSYGR